MFGLMARPSESQVEPSGAVPVSMPRRVVEADLLTSSGNSSARWRTSKRGDYIELTFEQLEHCAATGESPWPDESHG